jgi:alanyl-tRNA synthetase
MASRPTSETSSRSSTSSPDADGEARAHSAIHVLKGAVTKVLGQRQFTSAKLGEGRTGVLKAASDSPATAQEVSKIEAVANGEIAEDAEFVEFKMDRQEAEGHFGMRIYDLSRAPDVGVLLNIVRIPDWDASCCSQAHVESTGSIGEIRIDGSSFDGARKELELKFHLL